MKDLTDFAVLCKGATIPSSEVGLRVIPLASAPSVANALKGDLSLVPESGDELNKNMPKNDAGVFIDNVIKVQHKSGGYCRIIAKLTNNVNSKSESVEIAKGFVLFQSTTSDVSTTRTPIAVASLDAGLSLTQSEIYVAFTFSKTNNYQSVSFSPNAFATIEDINEINGLDGLHIAFDHASGDIKLLDKDGNVLDQANLHMDADTIIADGEEGYKYVKTDIQQDIHAEKDFMPSGKTAGASFQAESYSVNKACFLVDVTAEQGAVSEEQTAVTNAQAALAYAQEADPFDAQALANAQAALADAQDALADAQAKVAKEIREGTSDAIVGIRVSDDSGNGHTDYVIGGSYNNTKIGVSGQAFLTTGTPTGTLDEVYSPDAFVWTVGSDVGEEPKEDAEDNRTFAQKMNANAQALGFHVGDDIPLGTNISNLLSKMSEGDFDAEAYMHDTIEMNDEEYTVDELVDEQRNNAKEELVAWNAQHPGLEHDGLHGTRISENGLDVRDGKIQIGNGAPNADNDSVKRYVIETDIDDDSAGARADKGLQIGVIASQDQSGSDVQKDILTINAEDYISGAPTCLALLKCHKVDDGNGSTILTADLTETTGEQGEEVTVNVGRITANFNASGEEDEGVFTLTITDNRANNNFGAVTPTGDVGEEVYTLDAPRIVEIIPVYKSGADASEAVPAQRSISAIADKTNAAGTQLTIKCSQVMDWAQSIDLGGTVGEGASQSSNGMELYLIVKVY